MNLRPIALSALLALALSPRARAADSEMTVGHFNDFGCSSGPGIGCAGLTRPANTTAYASGELVCGATCAPLPVIAGRNAFTSSGSGVISKVMLVKSGATTTNAQFNVFLYAASPTFPGTLADQSAYVGPYLADITAGNYIGVAVCTNFSPTSDASPAEFSVCQLDAISSTIWHYRTSGKAVYATIEATAAYVPASAEKFFVATYEEQD